MDFVQILLLALIQGITEFLPISSSAHLILPTEVLGWPDQGLAFDVAVHFGSLIAVVGYFRREVVGMTGAWFKQFGSQGPTHESHLAWMIILATIPAGIVGLLANDFIERELRSGLVIAVTTIVFGIALYIADRKQALTKEMYQMGIAAALVIGCAQALALIPGTSRSGITITAALLLGFTRVDSARFSFFMSIPIIVLGAGFKTLELIQEPSIAWADIAWGTLFSAISAFLCIHFFLAFIERIGMLPFVVYRLILGAFLLFMFL
ncbi:undecaprenyl-diphosphate phosphatase [Halioxenophilus aromaticivorans]|uniref:Undecaprenyl-diphosphatase n=1 Tax=Halioxenophilus aromaticivorans TaxID=1306992 RepID=A0AAV3TXM6_9ALTE